MLGDLLTFLIQLPAHFTKLGEMIDADKPIHSQLFGSDPDSADTRIRIISKIRIRTPDHFELKLPALAEYVLSECCVVYIINKFL